MNSTQAVTRTINERLAERIGDHTYHMWFGNTTRLQVEGSCVRVATDNPFVADWIDRHFREDITGAARETLGDRAHVDLQVAPDLTASEDRPTPPTAPAKRNTGTAPGTALRRLDDFIVGTSNRLAYTAAIRIAEGTAGSTSPLYLHGECGVGKTHLLQGIAQAVRHRARYVTAEQFTNEYINAIRTNAIDRFRRQTRKLSLLAIDDVHFLSNKTATQREFLHTIDALDLSGSRLVLASDDHPLRLGFAEALSSRFVAGMVAGIERPDRETRISLIHKLAAARGLRISDIGTERIAGHCVGSVREIEGAVNKLAALQAVTGGKGDEIGIVTVEQVFNDASWRPKTRLHVNTVIDTVCARMVVNRAELMSTGRHRRVVAARGLVAYLARTLTTLSYPEIAHALGRKHHSTVHTAVARITRQLSNHTRIEVSEHGDSVCLRELLDQLRHEILSAR
jgi:chromosomal replication initiator protein